LRLRLRLRLRFLKNMSENIYANNDYVSYSAFLWFSCMANNYSNN